MAAPGARMRLTVVVEALADEDAHGEYRDLALAAFKERKFAMPVQLEDTFEMVWNDIEQRYKTNYLSPQQAATFAIKKLQDAYDCDLDMTDTVGAIFEGEPDRRMHVIKVIPHFVYRATSVVPGSMLRPSGAQKRGGADLAEGASKRRRVELQQRPGTRDARDPSPNRPIPSTESQQAAADGADGLGAEERSARSKSGMSLIELTRIETGQPPFSSTGVKQESPEPEPEPILNGFDAAPPDAPIGEATEPATKEQPQERPLSQSRLSSLREHSQEAPQPPMDDRLLEVEGETAKHVQTAVPEPTRLSQLGSQEDAIRKSPLSSVEPAPEPEPEPEPAPTPASATKHRRDVYQLPSSPDFMHKKATPDKLAKTYGRSPRSGADLLNMARRLGRSTGETDARQSGAPASTTSKARAFQRTQPDEIESTPQEEASSGPGKTSHATSDDDDDADLTASFLDVAAEATPNSTQTPLRKTIAKPVKLGSLKKPSRTSLIATPASTKRGARPKPAATPASTRSSFRSSAKGKTTTPASAGSSKSEKALGEETVSRMERLERLLSASQNTPKRHGGTVSPARRGSVGNHDRSNIPSPEVRVPMKEKFAPVNSNVEVIDVRLAVQPKTAQRTPIESPLPSPANVKTSTPISSSNSKNTAERSKPGGPDVFKKPAAKARESSAPSSSVKKASATTATGTPRRSEIPLPPNVRHLRRSSTLQSPPLANGNANTDKNNSFEPAKAHANLKNATSSLSINSSKTSVADPAESASTAQSPNDAIVIQSAESSSPDCSNVADEEHCKLSNLGMEGTTDEASAPAELQSSVQVDDAITQSKAINHEDGVVTKQLEQPKMLTEQTELDTTRVSIPQTQDKPPSGQGSSLAAPWGAESWGFGRLGQTKDTSDKLEKNEGSVSQSATAATPASEDEGFAEQDIYSTAIEDNASRSRSNSAAASTRSSPAVSRRPARFLSHSPTPDASESEDDLDEASVAPSRAISPQANDKDESESESESSSDSSEDGDVEMPDLPAESTTEYKTNAAPPSSPPLNGSANLTLSIPETSRSTPSQTNRPTQRTPVPLPTQQSSQAPRSSQSVSVQAADRRRYTGFRSLREQLADTKATQATTQKKNFDPRTMSLGKLAKSKSLVHLGGNDESSDDESSSSSSSDSD